MKDVKVVDNEIQATFDKEDLISLVKGNEPYYSAFDNKLIHKYGEHHGGFDEHWEWKSLDNATTEELIEIYRICKESWK